MYIICSIIPLPKICPLPNICPLPLLDYYSNAITLQKIAFRDK